MPEERSFFRENAGFYSKSPGHSRGPDLALLLKRLAMHGDESVLDVATGTGHTALAIAPYAAKVFGVDATEQMLAEAVKLAEGRELRNVAYMVADSRNLPFAPGSFDIVTCRRAAHHFQDKESFLSEVARVLRPGGRMALVDMSPTLAARGLLDDMERIRDRTHVRSYTSEEWRKVTEASGLRVTSLDILEEYLTLSEWLSPVDAGSEAEEAVRRRLAHSSLEELQAIGARPLSAPIEGWVKRRIVLVAVRESAARGHTTPRTDSDKLIISKD